MDDFVLTHCSVTWFKGEFYLAYKWDNAQKWVYVRL